MRMNEKQQLIFTWEDFWQYSDIISKTIIETGKTYNQIIAIARGGFYLGDYLSRRLQIPLSVIVAQSYSINNQRGELSLGELSYIKEPQGKVLLVDDLLDTGATMAKIESKLENDWNIEIDTAVIWQKSQCQYQADYYYSITPSMYWIVQPFEI